MFETKDTNLAAFLISRGMPLVGSTMVQNTVCWKFMATLDLEEIKADWSTPGLNCNARQLFLARNMLLDTIKNHTAERS